MNNKKGLKLDFNAPVILGFTIAAFAVLVLNWLTAGLANSFLAVYRTSWLSPLQYLRMFTYIFAHSGLGHYTGNFMLILAVGPLVEEKYGSKRLLAMIAITAAVTGLVNLVFFPRVALVGASGVVFMLILLASFVNIKQGHLPLTVILVAVLYIGQEVVNGIFVHDNISQLAHIIGGLCGAGFGFALHSGKKT